MAAKTMSKITPAAASVTLSRCSRHQTSFQYDIGVPDGPSRRSCVVLGCSSTIALGAPNAWVDEGLHDIDHEVQYDEKRRQHEDGPLQHGKIALKDRQVQKVS